MSLEEINAAIAQLSREEREQVRASLDRIEAEARERQVGFCTEQLTAPDDFDAPLPEEILRLFEDGPVFPNK